MQQRRAQRIGRQVFEFGYAQIGDGDEIGHGAEAALGLLEHSVHGLDIGVAATVEHAAHHAGQALLEGDGQAFKWFKTAAAGPGYPAQQILLGPAGAVGGHGTAIDLAQGLL